MRPTKDLDTLLAKSMLSTESLERLICETADNLMPFPDTRDNMILAAIHHLHAKQHPVDILTVFETLDGKVDGLRLDDLATMVKAPFLEPLRSETLSIRPFMAGDVDAFVQAFRESVSTVGAWLPWCHAEYSVVDAVQWFSNCRKMRLEGTAYDVGIFSPDGTELYGGVAINHINHENKIGNLGYWIRESKQRQKIAVQATCRMIDFGFKELALARLEIIAAEANLASRRLAERVGATLECISPNLLMIHGQPHSAAVYSLIPKPA